MLFVASIFSLSIHVLAMHWAPLRHVLSTAPLPLQTALSLAMLSVTAFVAMGIFKLVLALARRAA
jgi:hypothetical protein